MIEDEQGPVRESAGSDVRTGDARYWDSVAGAMLRRPYHLDPALGGIKREAYLRLLDRWAPDHQQGRALKTDLFEEAFGTDALLPELASRAKEAFAIDLSARTAAAARSRLALPASRCLCCDVRRLPFAGASFDLVLSPSTLDHFPDPADLGLSLRELYRVLRPEGRLIVTLDNRQNVFYPLLRLAARMGLIPFYLGRFYTIGEMCRELAAAGFEVRAKTAIVHNPRLMAVGSVMLARALNFGPFTRAVERMWRAAQRLEGGRWQYRTGTFLACLAEKPKCG